MQYKTWTNNDLKEAVATSLSMRQTLIKLGLAPYGGSYATLRKYIKILGLDTSHWKGQAINRGVCLGPQKPIEYYLCTDCPTKISTVHLKARLVKENIIPYKCDVCQIFNWRNQHLSLHLHHINGINTDNRLENLQLLCPNCHSQTDNYCNRAVRKRRYGRIALENKE